jgi:hypothetical protein
VSEILTLFQSHVVYGLQLVRHLTTEFSLAIMQLSHAAIDPQQQDGDKQYCQSHDDDEHCKENKITHGEYTPNSSRSSLPCGDRRNSLRAPVHLAFPFGNSRENSEKPGIFIDFFRSKAGQVSGCSFFD